MHDVYNRVDKKLVEFLWDEGCDLLFNEPLSAHVSFRLGGKVRLFVIPNSLNSFIVAISSFKNEGIEYRIIGKGTNILPSDEYKDFIVVSTERIDEVKTSDGYVYSTAGTPFKKLCLFAMENGLSGLEKAYGLPGSVGGAIYMNAGCYGWETSERVVEIDVYDGKNIFTISNLEAEFEYRTSLFKKNKDLIILGAKFKLCPDNIEHIKSLMTETIRKRYEKQPLEYPSAGSVFKRPRPDFYVGTAIESLGLKGYSVGDAQVSEKHAGFIINKGNAKANDVFELMDFVKAKIKQAYQVDLETEIEIWQ
ncbi:MAG TPA: UDP-N-acetylmuramate dehydrogenase [Fervidobacterium sp.]|nr:UDP-N-acetylmuramate dehydrogenase [Fervidobacterium sp.]HQE48460.1 UDP-N-acetylmuramate dehydrogenase [Fervidobacterium sp.]HUM42255.1 UDP-N-acetylmuramate dehydrogenase [Fervidobacterium sp.]